MSCFILVAGRTGAGKTTFAEAFTGLSVGYEEGSEDDKFGVYAIADNLKFLTVNLFKVFKDENISSELAMVIGCITESQKLINDAVESEEKGGSVNMCKALEKLEERGRQEGRLEGRLQGQIVTKLKLILKKVHKNKSFDQIVDELEEDSDVVQPLYDFVLKHIDLGEDEMVQKYLENIE